MPPAQRAARFFGLAHTAFAGLYGVLLPLAVLMLLAGYWRCCDSGNPRNRPDHLAAHRLG